MMRAWCTDDVQLDMAVTHQFVTAYHEHVHIMVKLGVVWPIDDTLRTLPLSGAGKPAHTRYRQPVRNDTGRHSQNLQTRSSVRAAREIREMADLYPVTFLVAEIAVR